LRLSRIGRAELTPSRLDMNQVLSEIVASMQFVIEQAGASIHLDPLPCCLGDQVQITQMFSNLLDNAVKYLDVARPGVIRVWAQESAEEVVFVVEDNGIGIAAVHHDAIYKLFHRLNPQKTAGEGLGLTIVRRVLDRHAGMIRVESEPGKAVGLACRCPRARGAPEPRQSAGSTTRRRHDDEPRSGHSDCRG